jgi:AcrR family transcriptional regulator
LARTGRRPGHQDTKEAILEAARIAFAEKGFDGASIRYIATSAGVDPALVHHYFGPKDQLFLAAMRSPIDPGKIIPQVAAGGIDGLGERLVRTFLGIWDSPIGSAGVALLRSAVRNDMAARLLREFITTQVMRRVLDHIDIDPAEVPTRASLIASQMLGLAMMRYVIKLEPIASGSQDSIVAAIGPTIQRYVQEPIKSLQNTRDVTGT